MSTDACCAACFTLEADLVRSFAYPPISIEAAHTGGIPFTTLPCIIYRRPLRHIHRAARSWFSSARATLEFRKVCVLAGRTMIRCHFPIAPRHPPRFPRVRPAHRLHQRQQAQPASAQFDRDLSRDPRPFDWRRGRPRLLNLDACRLPPVFSNARLDRSPTGIVSSQIRRCEPLLKGGGLRLIRQRCNLPCAARAVRFASRDARRL
jgi:hypothetical protein